MELCLYISPDKKPCLRDKNLYKKENGKEKPNHKDPRGLLSTSFLFQACSAMPPSINNPEHCMEMKIHKSSFPLREDDSLLLSMELRHIALESLRPSRV